MAPSARRLAEPEDVLQQALIALLVTGRSVPPRPQDLGTWTLAVAFRIIAGLVRGLRVPRRARCATVPPPPLSLPDPEGLAGVLDEDSEPPGGPERLVELLEHIPPAPRVCIVLRDLQDLPWETIAFLLGRSVMATRKLHERARRRLRRLAGERIQGNG